MSSVIQEVTTLSPYRGVEPFRYADRKYFIGREKVIEELYAKTFLYRLVLLFGESGAGKSSVINAGLIPALEKDGIQAERLRVSPKNENLPIEVERIEGDSEKEVRFLPSIFRCDSSAPPRANERIPYEIGDFLNTIRGATHAVKPLLIFDQFEELFTLFVPRGNGDNRLRLLAQDQILRTIYEIAKDQELETRILIIIREDFLGKLEVLSKNYPQIFDRRVRLGHLNENDAKRAIVGPFEKEHQFRSRITPDLANTIVRDLASDEMRGEVRATQLQIVCNQLWNKYAKTSPEITGSEFNAENGVKGILERYLASELDKLGPLHKPQAVSVLTNLITDSNTRDIVNEEKLRELLGVHEQSDKDVLQSILERMEAQRIINRITQRGTYYYEVSSEYLINPINQEKQRVQAESQRVEEERQRTLIDLEWRRKRNRWVVAFVGLVLLSPLVYWEYSVWRDNQPWGYMTNLSTVTIHDLRGTLISIGRSTSDFRNYISLSPRDISRLHLFISREHIAFDVRSLNGTTVNSTFLPYGISKKLEDGDIVTLAGIAPFKFSGSPMRMAPPSSAWAMVIDGKARTHHYLTGNSYALALNGDRTIIIKEADAAGGLLAIEKTKSGATITDVKDDYDLRAEMRVGDYTYFSCKVPPGEGFDYLDIRELYRHNLCEELIGRRDLNDITRLMHNLFTVTYKYGDTAFQLVPIVSDLEAPTPAS